MTTQRELAWLAGILEGEGCFAPNAAGMPVVALAMNDLDTIERAAKAWPGSTRIIRREREGRKDIFRVHWCGDVAIGLIETIFDDLSLRRKEKVTEVLLSWRASHTKDCLECGSQFVAEHNKQGICSTECKRLWTNRTQRRYRAERKNSK